MNYTKILDIYSLEEILEYNDVSPEDCLAFLVENEFIELPEIQAIDLDD